MLARMQPTHSSLMRYVIVMLTGITTSTSSSISDGTHDLSLCNSTQLAFWRWVWSVDSDTATTTHCGMATVYNHDLREEAGNHGERPWGKYCWRPHNCRYHKYSVESACHVLDGHGVLIIGDSTNYMFYQSLFMQLLAEGQPRSQIDYSDDFDLVCDGKVKLKYVRNDQILGNNTPLVPYHLDWERHIPDYDIVVVNKGCHIDHGDFDQNTVSAAIEFAKFMNDSTKTFVYRTTPQPHPYCTEEASPS